MNDMKCIALLIGFCATSLLFGCNAESPPTLRSDRVVIPPSADQPPSEGNASTAAASIDNQHPDAELVQADVRRLLGATFGSDVATMLEYQHPKVIDMLGGKSAAESRLQGLISQMQSLNAKLESLTFPEPPTFVESDVNRFTIVHTKSVMLVDGQRVGGLSYQVGIQKKGTSD